MKSGRTNPGPEKPTRRSGSGLLVAQRLDEIDELAAPESIARDRPTRPETTGGTNVLPGPAYFEKPRVIAVFRGIFRQVIYRICSLSVALDIIDEAKHILREYVQEVMVPTSLAQPSSWYESSPRGRLSSEQQRTACTREGPLPPSCRNCIRLWPGLSA